MSGSSYGTIYRVTTWGESHGKAIGAVIDGCPPGIALSEEDINLWLRRRKPGQSKYSTKRNEDDSAEVLSGVFEGNTTGTPISILIRNKDHRSADYAEIKDIYRPSHADFTYASKYGHWDYRGGGRSSGRETAGRVMAGAVAAKALSVLGISTMAYVRSIGDIEIDAEYFDRTEVLKNPLYMPDKNAYARAEALLDECVSKGDSVGGVVECVIEGLPVGLGEPVFDKLDAEIAKAVMSIGAVKGIEFGNGFESAKLSGSQNNDCFSVENGKIKKVTNNSGGVLGGISDGSPLVLRAAFKPTPSVSKPQKTVTKYGEAVVLEIKGRHDPVIAPRAAVVVESMVASVVLDMMLIQSHRKEWLR